MTTSTTTNATSIMTPIAVTIEPKPLPWARYIIGSNGEFTEHGDRPAEDNEAAVIALAGPPSAAAPINYDSTTARSAAAHLLGYAHRPPAALFPADAPLPESIATSLVDGLRTTTGTTWDLGDGLVLHYTVPFGARLTADSAKWTLTPRLATQWARALLTLATELDHAHAAAARTLHAERAGTTPIDNLRHWLDTVTAELTTQQRDFADRVRNALAVEEEAAHQQTVIAALDVAHPDLSTSLAQLHLLSGETVTHLHAADVIAALASRYALPIYVWTAESPYIQHEIDRPLSEHEWQRVGRTTEMGHFESLVENEQNNNGAALNVRRALQQAGVLCRDEECDTRITGEVVETFGYCPECRPDTLFDAVLAGCPGELEWHVPTGGGPCADCGLPLPANYDEIVAEQRVELELRDKARQAAEVKRQKVVELALQLIDQDGQRMAARRQMQQRGLLSADQVSMLNSVRAEAAQLSPAELLDVAETYLAKAERMIEQSLDTAPIDS